MQKVTVKKEELLKALRENKDNHRKIFEEALENYRKRVAEELERRLVDVEKGRKIDLRFNFPEPEDHTKDYDRVIRMAEMSISDEIELEDHEFQSYVMDDWSWRRAWTSNTVSYTSHA